jgi:hypothetical protein
MRHNVVFYPLNLGLKLAEKKMRRIRQGWAIWLNRITSLFNGRIIADRSIRERERELGAKAWSEIAFLLRGKIPHAAKPERMFLSEKLASHACLIKAGNDQFFMELIGFCKNSEHAVL